MRLAQATITAATVLALGACGNKGEAKEARRSLYDTDFAIVYRATLEAVRELYPTHLVEDPTKGKISTAWNPVSYNNSGADDPASIRTQDRALGNDPMGNSPSPLASRTSLAFKKYFIKFDVTVAGGRPWRVRVVGRAQEYEPGNALPTDLKGAQTPHWLPGRTDALVVSIHKKLKRYAVRAPENVKAGDDEPPPIDVTAYGPIPPAAAKRVGEVRRTISQRDYAGLRAMVADDVTWSLGAPPGADAALATWQADPAILEAMAAAIDAGCRGTEKSVACPPAATETPGFTGWRLTVQKNGTDWRITSFVQGD